MPAYLRDFIAASGACSPCSCWSLFEDPSRMNFAIDLLHLHYFTVLLSARSAFLLMILSHADLGCSVKSNNVGVLISASAALQ